MNDELRRFVRKKLEVHASREEIRTQLLKAGWRETDVNDALGTYLDPEGHKQWHMGIPIPRRKPSLSASEAFQYLMLFLCLGIASFAFGDLAFNCLNAWVPDPAQEWMAWSGSDASMAIAMLVVTLPLYVFLQRTVSRALAADPAKRDSAVRRWVSYLTLFIAGGTSIGTLIGIVYHVIERDFSLNSTLKLAVALGIAGTVFLRYLRDLRKDEKPS